MRWLSGVVDSVRMANWFRGGGRVAFCSVVRQPHGECVSLRHIGGAILSGISEHAFLEMGNPRKV